MATTPKLGVRLMASNDVQKEVVFNEAAVVFDAMVARSAKNRQNNPPSSPAAGDTYIIATAPTGAWSGYANRVALYFNGWRIFVPIQKMKFFNETSSTFWTYSGTGWTEDPAGTPSSLDDLTNVGGAAPNDGDVLTFDAEENLWTPQAPAPVPTLNQLANVNISTLLDGQILAWNESGNQWVNVAAPTGGGPGAQSLGDLSDVEKGSPGNGQFLRWRDGKARFESFSQPEMDLDDLNDVYASDPKPNDALVWNGAAWVPSTIGINYSFKGMVDGPRTFDGYANHFLVVDDAETGMTFKSLDELIASMEDFRLQDLVDVETPTDTKVGMFIRLKKSGASFSYEYVAQTDYSISAKSGETEVTARIRSMTFNGFDVQEPTEGNLILTAQNALEFQGDGTPVEGDPISAINFTGAGVNVTNIGGTLVVDVGDQELVANLADLQDVDMQTAQPVDGNVLKFDAISQKWVPGEGSGGGGTPIEDGEYAPATYELGPFAPPRANMFPGRLNAPSARLTEVKTRGLIVQGGPQTTGVKHAVVHRDLAFKEEPWVVTARVVPASFQVAGHAGGVVLQRAFNNAFVFLALGNSNSDTQFSLRLGWVSAAGAETILLTEPNQYNWLRLGFDGNFIRAWVSADGLVWQNFGNPVDPSTTLQGVPDRVGITNRSNASHDGSVGSLVTFWEDPDFPSGPRIEQGVVALGLNGLKDVDLDTTPPASGQSIVWDAASQCWLPGNPTAEQGGVGDLTDVDLGAGPEDGQTLVWSEAAGKWLPQAAGGGSAEYPPFEGNAGKALVVNPEEDGVAWSTVNGGGPTSAVVSVFAPGTYVNERIILTYPLLFSAKLSAGASGSIAVAGLAPSAAKSLTILKNGSSVGTIDFAASATGGTFTVASDVSFSVGDILAIRAPTSADAVLADVSVSLKLSL